MTNRLRNKVDNSPGESSQAGVTLLLSIILLSTITLVSFSVAATTFLEVRTSGDLLRTEPAYYADAGIAEEVIYGYKRGVANIQNSLGSLCPDLDDFTDYVGPASNIATSVRRCNNVGRDTFQVNVPRTADSYTNALHFYLVDPTDLTAGGGYESLAVENVSPGSDQNMQVYVCDLESEESCEFGTSETFLVPDSGGVDDLLLPGETRVFDSNVNASGLYEVILYWPADEQSSAEPRPGVVEFTSSPKPLPYLDRTVLEIESAWAGVTRRVQVFIPNR